MRRALMSGLLVMAGSLAATLAVGDVARGASPTRDGTIAFEGSNGLYVIAADGGTPRRIPGTHEGDGDPAWSPDGTQIAFDRLQENGSDRDIYLMNADGSNVRRLTTAPDDDGWPEWAPNGRTLAFVSKRDGPRSAYAIDVRRRAARRVVRAAQFPDWLPDGRIIYTGRSPGPSAGKIFTVRPYGADNRPLPTQPGNAIGVTVSNDGAHLAMQWCVPKCGERIGFDIYTTSADGTDTQALVKVSPEFATDPDWSPDDTWIVYDYPEANANRSNLYVVRIDGTQRTRLTNVDYACCASWKPSGR